MKKYCRLCYTFLTNSQLLGLHIQQTKLDLSRNQRGTSNQKMSMPTHSPSKAMYNTSPFLNIPQPSKNPMKLSATNFDHATPITTTRVITHSSSNDKGCKTCGALGRSTIRTSDGDLCFECYSKRNRNVIFNSSNNKTINTYDQIGVNGGGTYVRRL